MSVKDNYPFNNCRILRNLALVKFDFCFEKYEIMKKLISILNLLAFLTIFNACDKDGSENPVEPSVTFNYTAEYEAARLVNVERVKSGLDTLAFDTRIAEVARAHSAAMAKGTAQFSHDGFDQRVAEISKFTVIESAGENLAYNKNFDNPADQAVKDWLNSPPHKTNMLGDYNACGMGVAVSLDGKYYFTQLFVKKKVTGLI